MITDGEKTALEANIRNLERLNRELRETLRDRFAMAAMAAFIEATSDHSGIHPQCDERVAERAYEMADVMIQQRKETV